MSLQPEEPKSVLQSFDLYSKLSLEIWFNLLIHQM
jgi:hypothetical protein